MVKSWRTTIGGLLAAAGLALQAVDGMNLWGAAIAAFGAALLGVAARDNRVSSEVAGAKPEEPKE